jgi:chromate transporter
MRETPLFGLTLMLMAFSVVSIGGGPSIFAPLQHQVTAVMGWLTPREFIDLFAIARVAPGPGMMLSTLIGWKLAGIWGGVVATLALFVPSSVVAMVVARYWMRYRGHRWHRAAEAGLAPIAVGLLFAGAMSIMQLSAGSVLSWTVALTAGGLLSWRPRLHPFVVLFGAAFVYIAAEFWS